MADEKNSLTELQESGRSFLGTLNDIRGFFGKEPVKVPGTAPAPATASPATSAPLEERTVGEPVKKEEIR